MEATRDCDAVSVLVMTSPSLFAGFLPCGPYVSPKSPEARSIAAPENFEHVSAAKF